MGVPCAQVVKGKVTKSVCHWLEYFGIDNGMLKASISCGHLALGNLEQILAC